MMRLKIRARLFYGTFMVGFIPLVLSAVAIFGEWSEMVTVFGVAWFAAFATLQFFWLKCPHCRRVGIITPLGFSTPWVGDRCRYCGKDY